MRSNPIIAEAEINRLYAESEFIFSGEAPYAARTYQALLQRLMQRHDLTIRHLLEVGCSTGFFLQKALALGIEEAVGFEPSLDCYKAAPSEIRGHIINDIFSRDRLGEKQFDLACSFQVIDHLRDPKQAVISMSAALKPGGHLLIVCHDVESWTAKILGDHSPIFDVEHIYLFSRKTMSRLFQSAGLEIVEAGALANTYPLGYWMRMLPLANKLIPFTPGFIRNLPLRLNVGNLFVLGRKIATS